MKQDPTHLHYRSTWPTEPCKAINSVIKTEDSTQDSIHGDDTEMLLHRYFNLHLDLPQMYEQWSRDDANFRKKAPKFNGIRILNQDAWEALIAFICSSNNNIARISQMVHKLCVHYGPLIGKIGDEAFHDFPSPEALAGPSVEPHLRTLGFGYRAKYLADTAGILANHKPAGWLTSLRNPESPSWGSSSSDIKIEAIEPTYKHAHEQLLTLSGVGPKVADCVCLMGLGWAEAVPVDTHVWQIAVRDYKFAKAKTKTFSKVMHEAVGDHFRGLWGKHAGWAQSVLFTANLRSFSDRLTAKVEDGAAIVKKEEEEVLSTDSGMVSRKRRMSIVDVDIKNESAIVDGKVLVTARSIRAEKRRKVN